MLHGFDERRVVDRRAAAGRTPRTSSSAISGRLRTSRRSSSQRQRFDDLAGPPRIVDKRIQMDTHIVEQREVQFASVRPALDDDQP